MSVVFTNRHCGLVNRQAIVKDIERAARKAGIDSTGLATHTGRRTVITALDANGELDLVHIGRSIRITTRSIEACVERSRTGS